MHTDIESEKEKDREKKATNRLPLETGMEEEIEKRSTSSCSSEALSEPQVCRLQSQLEVANLQKSG